tara:strand:+ start:672 stop:1499 length:828 start_codon:yes stop_codon:yes gene_type:complete
MRAEIKTITPELAKELLKMNVGNRRLKSIKNAYVGQMLNGEWKENGEPIIIDVNGFIKDGQHRLNAVIEAKHSYLCPIIYDVHPDVMDTIDTGTNRTMSDILQLNGFIYYADLSSLIKSILTLNKGNNGLNNVSGAIRVSKTSYISNNMGLNYANENKEGLLRLIKSSEKIYNGEPIKVMGRREVGLIIYLLGGFDFNEFHIDFVKKITGVIVDDGSVTSWLYKKLASAKINKVNINSEWKKAAVIRAWNIYANGDIPVSHLKINVDKMEEVTKI